MKAGHSAAQPRPSSRSFAATLLLLVLTQVRAAVGGAEFAPAPDGQAGWHPVLAADAQGRFVAVWTTPEVLARRYDADATALGEPFQVNAAPVLVDDGAQPDVAMAPDGAFVVVWHAQDAAAARIDVFAQRYGVAGEPVGSQFRVNANLESDHRDPAVALDADGGFVVVWGALTGSGHRLLLRRFTADGAAAGSEITVFDESEMPPTMTHRSVPDVAVDAAGTAHVAWRDGFTIHLAREAAGVVSRSIVASEAVPTPPVRIALLPEGPLVLWETFDTVHGRRYGFDGQPLAGEFRVSTVSPVRNSSVFEFRQGYPLALAANETGAWVAAWQGDGGEIYARRYAEDGLPDSLEFAIEKAPGDYARHPAAAIKNDGNLIIARAVQPEGQPEAVRGRLYQAERDPTDTDPDPFAFPTRAGVEPNTLQVSDPVTITGIDDGVPLVARDGEYSVDGGPFTSELGHINDGAVVRLRHATWPGSGASTSSELIVGQGYARFETVNKIPDTQPDAFAFADLTGVERSATQTSNAITVTGINDPASISVTGGFYSVNGAAFRGGTTTVTNGASVRVQHFSSSSYSGTVNTTLTIGGVSDTFSSTTVAANDTTPNPFTFTDVGQVPRNTSVTSNAITVTGIGMSAPISVSGGSYSIGTAAFTSSPGSVSAGQAVRVRHTSAGTSSTATHTTLTIGGVTDTFTSTTVAWDTVPDSFAFAPRTDVPTGAGVMSDPVTISGITEAAPVTVTGGAYSIGGAAFTTAAGSITNGQSVRVQHTSAGNFATSTSTTLAIGGVSADFVSTTVAQETADGEYRANQTAGAAQPAVALDPRGNFLVAYSSADGGALADVYAVRGRSHGLLHDPDRVTDSSATGSAAYRPTVARDDAGNFVVAWVASDGSGNGVFARRYAADGSPRGTAFRVNTYTVQNQASPAVAMDADGDFVVVWQSDYQEAELAEIYAQRYAADGTPRGSETRVNVEYRNNQFAPSVAMDAAGNFAVAWIGGDYYPGDSGSLQGIWLRLFNASGTPRTSDIHANTYTGNQQWLPDIGMSRTGEIVVAWQSYGQDLFSDGVYAQRFGATGAKLGDEFQVNTMTAGAQSGPQVAVDADGDFVVAWKGQTADRLAWNIYGQAFGRDGTRRGGEFKVNSSGPYAETEVAIAGDADGDLVVAWQVPDATEGSAVQVRRLAGGEPIDLRVWVETREAVVDWGGFVEYDVRVANGHAGGAVPGLGEALDVDVELVVEGGEVHDTYGDGWSCDTAFTRCRYAPSLPAGAETPSLTVVVRSPAASGTQSVQANAGGVQLDPATGNNVATASVQVADRYPDSFEFGERAGVASNTLQLSDTVVLSGFDVPLDISVSGGEYSVNSAAFTAAPSQVLAGDTVVVRHLSASTAGTTTTTWITIGDVTDDFRTTTDIDTVPEPFIFADPANVPVNTVVTSNAVTVSGINAAAAISVVGGSYSINGAAFTTIAGSVGAGQSVRVQHTSASTHSTSVTTTLTIGGVSEAFVSTTAAVDTRPDTFAFQDQAGLPRSTTITSNEVTITGINDAAPISINGGQYSIDGGAFTYSGGTIRNGQKVRVRHTTSPAFQTSMNSVLNVGGASDTFTTTTQARDVVPNAFAFPTRSGVLRNANVQSDEVTVSGINDATPIGVSGGEYSINGAAFTSAAGAVTNNQKVRVRHTSAAGFSAPRQTSLNIGGVSGTFTSVTEAEDTTPNAFSFQDQSGVLPLAEVTSNAIAVTGINSNSAISISGGSYAVNGGAYTTASGTVRAGDTVTLRVTSGAVPQSVVNVTLMIGGVSDTWTVKTLP